jgi:hypothetical protein
VVLFSGHCISLQFLGSPYEKFVQVRMLRFSNAFPVRRYCSSILDLLSLPWLPAFSQFQSVAVARIALSSSEFVADFPTSTTALTVLDQNKTTLVLRYSGLLLTLLSDGLRFKFLVGSDLFRQIKKFSSPVCFELNFSS